MPCRKEVLKIKNIMSLISLQVSITMFELMVSIHAALLRFKDLEAVLKSLVIKLESIMVPLNGIKYSA